MKPDAPLYNDLEPGDVIVWGGDARVANLHLAQPNARGTLTHDAFLRCRLSPHAARFASGRVEGTDHP